MSLVRSVLNQKCHPPRLKKAEPFIFVTEFLTDPASKGVIMAGAGRSRKRKQD
jgi:hypothetical protein